MISDTVAILLRRGAKAQEPLDPAEWKRVKARVAWDRHAQPCRGHGEHGDDQ